MLGAKIEELLNFLDSIKLFMVFFFSNIFLKNNVIKTFSVLISSILKKIIILLHCCANLFTGIKELGWSDMKIVLQ